MCSRRLCVVGEYSRVNRKHEDAAALTIVKIELENNDSHNLLAHPIPSHPSLLYRRPLVPNPKKKRSCLEGQLT
jgi:hypothetical protein